MPQPGSPNRADRRILILGAGFRLVALHRAPAPQAYRQAGHVSIAVLVSITLGAIVLLEGSLP